MSEHKTKDCTCSESFMHFVLKKDWRLIEDLPKSFWIILPQDLKMVILKGFLRDWDGINIFDLNSEVYKKTYMKDVQLIRDLFNEKPLANDD